MKPERHTEKAVYRLGYTAWAFGALRTAGGLIGRKGSAAIGRLVGRVYARANPGIVGIVADNLALLEGFRRPLPEVARVFELYGMTISDYLWLGTRSPAEGFNLASLDGGIEHLREIGADSGGAILATGHFGFFEFGALVLGQMGWPVSVVTFSEPSAALTSWRASYRRRWGAETIELGPDAFSSLRVNEAIERGRLTAMLVDRPMGGRSCEVALAGGRIACSQSPALLSWMTGCAILPVTVHRTSDGRYSIRSGAPLRCDRSLPREQALAKCTTDLAHTLASQFLLDPLQWFHFVPLRPTSA